MVLCCCDGTSFHETNGFLWLILPDEGSMRCAETRMHVAWLLLQLLYIVFAQVMEKALGGTLLQGFSIILSLYLV